MLFNRFYQRLITSGNLQLLIGKIIYICTNGTEWFWVLMTMMHIIITAVLSLHIQAKYDKIWWDLGKYDL